MTFDGPVRPATPGRTEPRRALAWRTCATSSGRRSTRSSATRRCCSRTTDRRNAGVRAPTWNDPADAAARSSRCSARSCRASPNRGSVPRRAAISETCGRRFGSGSSRRSTPCGRRARTPARHTGLDRPPRRGADLQRIRAAALQLGALLDDLATLDARDDGRGVPRTDMESPSASSAPMIAAEADERAPVMEPRRPGGQATRLLVVDDSETEPRHPVENPRAPGARRAGGGKRSGGARLLVRPPRRPRAARHPHAGDERLRAAAAD